MSKTTRSILALAAALMALTAHAQNGGGPASNPCAVPEPNTPLYYSDLATGAPFACMPGPGGDGVNLMVRYGLQGIAAYWYCPDATPPTKYTLQFGAATWARLATGSLTPDTPLSDPSLSPIWCPHMAEARAAAPVVTPPGTWKVISPAAFRVVNTTLSGYVGPVAIGTLCDCAVPVRIGAATYCTFAGASMPSVMASCRVAQ